ncbi:hypothetical protein [Isoalcanivorax beigongshangi]|uniref:Secreted protein n=1 Tax=Isoalcanivorax beigongshangi TaxID=3238810 RepID=A0ABV4AER3_9GAMM
MKKKLLTGLTGVAAAVALAGVASTASAMAPPYVACVYKGETSLDLGGSAVNCWLNMSVKADCDGNVVEITAAGANPGDSTCAALFLGGFPWTSTLSGINSGTGNINTGTSMPYSVLLFTPSGISPIAGGVVELFGSPAAGDNFACDGKTITLPKVVDVNPGGISGNFGGSVTFTGALSRIACGEHL